MRYANTLYCHIYCINNYMYLPPFPILDYAACHEPTSRNINSCVQLFACILFCIHILFFCPLTSNYTIIDYVILKHGLRRKQNCIYVNEKCHVIVKIKFLRIYP